MVHPVTREQVPPEEVRRGVEVDEGVYVVLSEDELAMAEPEASRDIEITRFVPKQAVDAGYFDRPYYLGPDGDDAAYAAVAPLLQKTGRLGIAQWTMRGKRYHGVLEGRGNGLVLVTLRSAEEVVPASALERPTGSAISPAERKLAEQLVATLDAPFDPAAFHDEYRERLQKLIAAKARGRKLKVKEAPPPAPSESVTEALRASLRRARTKSRPKETKVA
jgi:DNA end-binding protein Ku